MIRTLSWILISLTVSFGCQSYIDGSKRTAGEFTDDAQITAMVKLKLLDDAEIKGWRINVSTSRGVVTLEESTVRLRSEKRSGSPVRQVASVMLRIG